ncbi:MAG: serine/threonine protein kinase [Planctomycetia bacterium]|nr:serine/threonine protein kinase [Planctomycetia bacterium]
MSVPLSVEELLQLIQKSGMVDEQKLSAYLQRRELTAQVAEDPQSVIDEMVQVGILTYFQAEQFAQGKWRGFTIGKFKLLERIGVGGMGQVFLCEHMFIRKRVAIKVLPPAKADQPAALGRFYREARAAGSLEHANIVRTHDIDQDGDLHFIVMDYVDGANLLEVVKKFGPMDIRRALSYVRQTASALDYAFRNGIIHRDVKPGNIIVDRKGVARLLDLGLARFFKDHVDQLTLKYDDKIVLGTADYVAPEQVANSHSVDIRADIYALGATFYFLLAGHPPFPLGTVSQKLLCHRTKEPTPIRQIRPELPEALAEIVTKMLAKDPRARFQTPAQVVTELETWTGEPVPLPAEEEMPQLSPAAREGWNMDGTAEIAVVPLDQPNASAEAGSAAKAVALANGSKVAQGVGGSKVGSGVVRANPFGTPTASPWALTPSGHPHPLTGPFSSSSAAAQSVAEPVASNSPNKRPNPFAEEHTPTERTAPWVAIVGGLVAVIGLGILLAKLLG